MIKLCYELAERWKPHFKNYIISSDTSVNKSKVKTIKKHLKKLSYRIKLSYKLVSSDRNDYAQTTRVKLENANKPIKEVYEYLKNKHRREKRKGIKKSYNSNLLSAISIVFLEPDEAIPIE